MRQGNGTELPGFGPDDPRGASIGIIEVAPGDERKSVLAAILTQEKLGRKQVAVVLPDDNKAFVRAQDFDDLKGLKRKLQAEIIFIIPTDAGHNISDYARQRRFKVYFSLASFANALQHGDIQDEVEPKKGLFGGLFGGGKARTTADVVAGGAVGAAVGASARELVTPKPPATPSTQPPMTPTPRKPRVSQSLAPAQPIRPSWNTHDEDEDMDDFEDDEVVTNKRGNGGAMLGAAAVGAAGGVLAEEAFRPRALPVRQPVPLEDDFMDEEDEDDLPPAPIPMKAPLRGDSAAMRAVPSRGGAAAAAASAAAASGSNGPASRPPSPAAIELPSKPAPRSTVKLPDHGQSGGAGVVAAVPIPIDGNPAPNRGAGQRRNNNTAAMGGAVAGGALFGASAASASSRGAWSATGGTPPPSRGRAVRGRSGRSGWRTLFLLLLLLLITLLIGGFVFASVNPVGYNNVVRQTGVSSILPGAAAAAPATLTITPDSKLVQDSYQLHAVKAPNKDQREVGLRDLSFTTPAQTVKVTGTGQRQTPGVAATGKLTFFNGLAASFTVSSSIPIPVGNGVSVVPDDAAPVPAGSPPTYGSITVPAHVTSNGSNGNIAALSLNNRSCCSASIFVSNPVGFTGGQDPQNYTFIQQGDVDAVFNPIKEKMLNDAQSGVRAQVKANEQMLGPIRCDDPRTSIDAHVGADTGGASVTGGNLTATQACFAQVYDKVGAQSLVTDLLKSKASTDPGAGYALIGDVATDSTVQTGKGDNVPIQINAKGVWVYQFTDAQEHDLLASIAGKKVSDALTLLKSHKGIANAKIDMNGTTLPTDIGLITISIQKVPGLTGTPSAQPTVIGSQSDSPVSGAKGLLSSASWKG